MKYRKLGGTDIKVSAVCQGCWSLVSKDWTWGPNAPGDSLAAIGASLEAGVNFFDAAEVYGGGESEEILGRAVADVRKDVIIATKVSSGRPSPKDIRAACERSLRRLGTDYIDLYQIHWPSRDIPLAETLGGMEELRSEGKIRAVGVSNFGVSYLRELAPVGRVQSNQVAYNLLFRPLEHEVLPMCVEQQMSILCYSSLSQGILTGKFASPDDVPPERARTRLFSGDREHSRHGEGGCEEEVFAALAEIRRICDGLAQPMGRVSLAWLLGQEGVTSVIVGGRNAAQAAENAKAAELDLDAATLAALSKASEPVKEKLGRNTDMWQHDSRMER